MKETIHTPTRPTDFRGSQKALRKSLGTLKIDLSLTRAYIRDVSFAFERCESRLYEMLTPEYQSVVVTHPKFDAARFVPLGSSVSPTSSTFSSSSSPSSFL